MPRIECPKCRQMSAWHEADRQDVWLRCLCGYAKVVLTRLETIEITHVDAGVEVRLPRRDTNLWRTLLCLSALQTASSLDVTTSVNDLGYSFTVAEVSSYLTILKQRGLVHPLNSRRGLAGGSTWEVTPAGKGLLGA